MTDELKTLALQAFFEQTDAAKVPRTYAEDWIGAKERLYVDWYTAQGQDGKAKFLEYLSQNPVLACLSGWEYDGRNLPKWIEVANGQLQGAGKVDPSDNTQRAP